MKLMFASDIHGSASCCGQLLKLFEREKPQRLILLGDILYHGPRNPLPDGYAPAETAAMLNGIKERLLCVRGNCDSEVDQMMLDFPIMADYSSVFADKRMIFCTHGHLFNSGNAPFIGRGDAYISGHTHIFGAHTENGSLYLNTGSVSLPKNGNPQSCIILEDNIFYICTLDGRRILETAFPEC